MKNINEILLELCQKEVGTYKVYYVGDLHAPTEYKGVKEFTFKVIQKYKLEDKTIVICQTDMQFDPELLQKCFGMNNQNTQFVLAFVPAHHVRAYMGGMIMTPSLTNVSIKSFN